MWLDDARAHAAQEHPREACGLVVMRKGREVYVPCRNVATEPLLDFAVHPEDWASASEQGDVTRVVHSHPNGDPLPSDHDRASCEETQLQWVILGGDGFYC
jgi:proteasome lid subunit RPN8/RPN11